MSIGCFIFDWNSFWINIIAGLIFFVLSILVSTWLIPKYTVKLIRKKNKRYSITKIGAVLQELCEFLSDSPYRDESLYSQHISVCTRKKDLNNYRFIALCCINVFNNIVFPKMTIAIHNYYEGRNPNESYMLISEELNRLKEFRIEIERILMVHSLHIDENIIQKISNLCFDIKALEAKYKFNIIYDELIEEIKTKEQRVTERSGVFGLNEIPPIYNTLLQLIKELISLNYFEYKIENTK